jgi:hypothetical protein
VSAGGDSSRDNLVTSCADCNQGKRADVIVTPVEWEDSELRRLEAQQRLSEYRAYRQLKEQLDEELAEITESIAAYWRKSVTSDWVPRDDDLRFLLDDHDPQEIEKALYVASRQSSGGPEDIWRYACAVLRNWRQAAFADRKE